MSSPSTSTPLDLQPHVPPPTAGDRVYRYQCALGEGAFGEVLQCLKMDTKETVAIKMLKTTEYIGLAAIQELAMLSHIKTLDPDTCCIVRFHESFDSCGRTCLVFEKLDVALDVYIDNRSESGGVPLKDIRPMMKQLLTALKALESIRLIHSDIKPDNVMLVDRINQPLRVKLIDFGLAVPVSEVEWGTTLQPISYRAPEVILGLPISEAIDMWSLGCVMAATYLGDHLYPDEEERDTMAAIVARQGLPADHLLDAGLWTCSFFTKTIFPNEWMLKQPLEYFTDQEIKSRWDSLSQLDPLPVLLKYKPTVEDECEERDHQAFLDLIKGMLHLDATLRVTPNDALTHPFLRLTHLVDSYDNSSYAQDSFNVMNKILLEDDRLGSEDVESFSQRGQSPVTIPLQDTDGEEHDEEGASGEDDQQDDDMQTEDEEEGDIDDEEIIREEDEEGAVQDTKEEEEEEIRKGNEEEGGPVEGVKRRKTFRERMMKMRDRLTKVMKRTDSSKETRKKETLKERMVKRTGNFREGIMKRWNTFKKSMTRRQSS